MKRINNQPNLKNVRKILRNNMTEEELILWSRLKGKQLGNCKFRRQHSVGKYVVDFYCPEIKLAIELDGGKHYDTDQEEYDRNRTEYLDSVRITVLRFSNLDIWNNLEGVLSAILEFLQTPSV